MSTREQLVGEAFEMASEGLLVFADDGRWIEANREAYRLLAGAGRPVGELIGGLDALLEEGAARGSFDTALGRVEYRASARIADGAHLLVLRQADESRLESSLVATLNRELRIPLTGVVGVCGLLETTQLDARQREYVEALRTSADALATVVEGLLDFSTLGDIVLAHAQEPFDLRTVVEDVTRVGALAASGAAVEVICHVDPQLPAIVRGDERRVRQVLMTLVGNAVKFTPHGEVVVTAALADRADGAGAIRFGVADTGLGIDARGREAIFEAFAAVADENAGAAGEAGLGLAVARRLVSTMGGELGVQSAPGEGTSFSFELPLRVDPADPALAEPGGLDGARVLVVEPRVQRARLYVRQLEAWGALATIAADRAGALTQLAAAREAGSPHDLVIAGRDLAGAGELARQIAADGALATVRTAVCGDPGATDAQGADAVLAGPFGRRSVHAALAALLASEPAPRAPAPSPGSVLLAEDSSVNELVAVTLLEERGFRVDVARNGIEALELHAQGGYDLIFMDCEMPELDGYETTREIRRREGDECHTLIVAMTASTLPDDRERCMAAGMDYHTGKPIRPAGLDYIIAQAIRPPVAAAQ